MSNLRSKLTPGTLALAVMLAAALAVSAQGPKASNFANAPYSATSGESSTISTLYTQDPLAGVLCFADGKEGYVVQGGKVRNRCSHIDFDRYNAGALTVGIEGGELGAIIDIGTPDDLKTKYGYGETVGKGQGFASIAITDGKFMILKNGRSEDLQELTEAAQLFTPGGAKSSAEAKTGHIYLARITDSHDKSFQILVKLLVLSSRPGESVTFRWELL